MEKELKLFKKAVTINFESNSESNLNQAFQRIEEFIKPRFYNCELKIVVGILKIGKEIDRVKIQIYNCGKKLRKSYNKKETEEFLDDNIERIENEIIYLKKLVEGTRIKKGSN